MKTFEYWKVIGVAGALAGLVAWPGACQSQLDLGVILPPILPVPAPTTATGQASVATASVLGNVTSLVDTGTLTDPSEPLGAGLPIGSIPGLLTAESLHAVTMGWTDQVASEASLSN